MSPATQVALPGVTETWSLWSTSGALTVTDPEHLGAARRAVDAVTAAVDDAANRFRGDSEISRLARADGAAMAVSPTFLALLDVALEAARVTDGLVDPTVGAALIATGYDRDVTALLRDGSGPVVRVSTAARPDWRVVAVDHAAGTVRVPAGVVLDLGATAKAWAADTAAQAAFDAIGAPVMVGLGGDLAIAGVPADSPGFSVQILERRDPSPGDAPAEELYVPQGGVATSSTVLRRWTAGSRAVHHLIDPRTALPAPVVWRTATVLAHTCVAANAASTAAVIMGDGARDWLAAHGLPARLVAHDGRVVHVASWPVVAASWTDGPTGSIPAVDDLTATPDVEVAP